MAKFLTGNELNSELEKLFDQADEQIILISPYIKLHDRYASTLRTKMDNPKLKITVVFGKNEEDISRSMKQEDFNFFKEFPNIQIRYEKRLHAKYYASESSAIMTSMNLHSFSQDNNIEAGVITKATLLGNLATNIITNVTGEDAFDSQAETYFNRVIEQAELLFLKTPQFDKGLLGMGVNKKYLSSTIEVDKLSDFFSDRKKYDAAYRKENGYEGDKRAETSSGPAIANGSRNRAGFCIRTGVPIPFNVEKPMSYDAYIAWNKFGNPHYAENYCHFSGEPSNGETSVSRPILKKNWKKAQEFFDLNHF
jgi:phosphatidylserine/phosphatidylglycerophosphate/cardiolipin synthase-like enzyme